MSRERPESWEEIDAKREYWLGDTIETIESFPAWLLRIGYKDFPPDLLLVPTREEWEAAQKLLGTIGLPQYTGKGIDISMTDDELAS